MCNKHGITIEHTTPSAPQFNAKVEREFPALQNMTFATLMSSNLTEKEQMTHWAHAINGATILQNLQPRGQWKNACKAFGQKPPVQPKDLIKFGAKGWMAARKNIKAKWVEKSEPVMQVSCSKDGLSDTCIVCKKTSTGKRASMKTIPAVAGNSN